MVDLQTFDPSNASDGDTRQAQRQLDVKDDGAFGPISKGALKAWRAAHPVAFQPADTDNVTLPFDTGVVSARSESVIASLSPILQPLIRGLIHGMAANGKRFEALSGYRSYAQQEVLHEAHLHGGPQATSPGNSVHNFALACDMGYFLPDGRYADDLEGHAISTAELGKIYTEMGEYAEKHFGLTWGGRWHQQDMPHVEIYPPWAKGLTEPQFLAALRSRHANGESLIA